MRQFRPQTPSRPQTPVLRRPASTMSMRSNRMGDISPLRRPQTPLGNRETYQGTISVGVRVKPTIKAPVGAPAPQLQLSDNRIETDLGEFTFDNVYAPGCANRDVFESSVRDLVGHVMNGFNGTVFAYGMTGTGKTHSMQGTPTDPGIIPLSAETLFAAAAKGDYKVRVSYLEIYNEHLNDLLNPSTPSEDIKLREDALRGVRAYGLKEVLVSSPTQLLDVVQRGDACRRTEGTEFNARSSRSHAVVQISVEGSASPLSPPISATLYLCDLAGSERAADNDERRKEGSFINKSLLTLALIIGRLSDQSTGAAHLPFRDSKLTRLLQPALSGKSLVSVLCTVHGDAAAAMETLRFAARTKNISVSVRQNTLGGDARADRLQQQLDAARAEIETLKKGGALPRSADDIPTTTRLSRLESENKILRERLEHSARMATAVDEPLEREKEYKSYIQHLERQLGTAEEARTMFGAQSPEKVFAYQRERIEELEADLVDKDKIISALNAVNRRKANMTSNMNTMPLSVSPTQLRNGARAHSPEKLSVVRDPQLNILTKEGLNKESLAKV